MKSTHLWVVNIIRSVMLLILGWVGNKITEDIFTQKVVSSETGVLAFIAFFLVLLTILVGAVFDKTISIEQRVGIRVTYVDSDTGEDRKILFQRARRVVESAQESILVLNSFVTEKKSIAPDEGITYYQTLIRKAKEGVRYERILQLREGDSVATLLEGDLPYTQHFHAMLQAKDANPRLKIAIRKTRARYWTTFVLVDGRKLLWSVNELLVEEGTRMRGIFIFDDPRQEITQHFTDFFEQIAFDNETVPIKREELPPLPEPHSETQESPAPT